MSVKKSLYKLRCSLTGHSMDVRGVTSGEFPDGSLYIASASRDKTSRIWTPSGDGGFDMAQINEGHTKYVSSIFILPSTTAYPSGLLLTGGHDHSILGFEIGQLRPAIFRLVGHRGNVCSLDYSPEGLLVSGSWDMTAKVWKGQENIETLTGHEAAVWSVAVVPGPIRKILTGSADREIRLWINSKTVTTYKGHTDCVRTLVTLDHARFLSCSNDASIRLWNIETGQTLNTFYGHTNYIYNMARFHNSEDFVTVGEDRTVRVWHGEECKQVIHLPALSVWAVATMKNGDIVTGSSDGVIRVFTCDPSRVAHPDILAIFEEDVASSTIAAQQELGGMKISDLPGPETLLREGKRDGDTTMVREGSKVACYSWSAGEHKWNKVGDVVGASGATQNTSGKQLHDGQEYDYVFTIELDDKSTLKLPYNITEDPWFVAQKFIDKHNLPQSHLDQVATFITKNTAGMQLGVAVTGYEDPFTGSSRYVPGVVDSNTNGGGVDPFTGSGAYRTAAATAAAALSSSSMANPTTSSNSQTNLEFPIHKFQAIMRGKLNQEYVKLWQAPFYNEATETADDGEVLALASRYATELSLSVSDSVDCIYALQRNAIEKLAEKDFFKKTGMATLRMTFSGFSTQQVEPSAVQRVQIDLTNSSGKDLKIKIGELIGVNINSLKLISSGKVLDESNILSFQNIKNGSQIMVLSTATEQD